MTLEILCSDLCDFIAKSVGAASQNVFYKRRPDGGARGDPCEKSDLEVVNDLALKECVCKVWYRTVSEIYQSQKCDKTDRCTHASTDSRWS